MRIGASLVLIAIGAILRFAVSTESTHGFNVWTVGVILMIVGAVGLVLTLIWSGMRRRTDVVEHVEPGHRRTTYVTPGDGPTQDY